VSDGTIGCHIRQHCGGTRSRQHRRFDPGRRRYTRIVRPYL